MTLPEWIKSAFEWLIAMLIGGFGLEWYKRYLQKDKDNLEVAKLKQEGTNFIVEYRTNLNVIIEQETRKLKIQINELKELHLEQAKEILESEKEKAKIISDLEGKMNKQFEFNQKTTEQLQEEIKLRIDCMRQLQELRIKLNI